MGRSGLQSQSFGGTSAQCLPFLRICDQFHKHQWKFRRTYYPDSIVGLKESDDIPEILGVVSYHNRHSVLCRFNNVVPPARNQAAAHKGDVRQGINGRELADGIAQQHSATDGFALPCRAAPEADIQLPQQFSNFLESLRMARR